MIESSLIVALISAAISAGVAFGGARAGARGTSHELREFKQQSERDRTELREMVAAHIRDDASDIQRRTLLEVSTERRMSRVETLLEAIHKRIVA